MFRPTLIVLVLFLSHVYARTMIGNRETGDQLVYAQFLEAESPTPRNLLLRFRYEVRSHVERVTAIICLEEDDGSSYHVVQISGPETRLVEFTMEAWDATYHRAHCNYYGFYN